MVSWGHFVIPMGCTTYCIQKVELEHWHRAQLITSFLFVISSVFVLATNLRDH
jgi:hypothetical protein